MNTYTTQSNSELLKLIVKTYNKKQYDKVNVMSNEILNRIKEDKLEPDSEVLEILSETNTYKIEKDFSDVSNNELLEIFAEASYDEYEYEYNAFEKEQLRKEILSRMNSN